MIAIGNSGKSNLIDAAAAALDSDSPTVRGAAVWALGRLCGPEEGRALARRRAAHEIDADVIAKWRDAFPR
jgi:epoxyqueuosine reductase